MPLIYSITNMKDEEHVLGTSLHLGHLFQPEFPTWVWKMFKFQVFNPNLPRALPQLWGEGSSGKVLQNFPIISILLSWMMFFFPSGFIASQWPSASKCTLEQGKNSFQIIIPSSQSPPESPQHQCLSWVIHEMEPHTVCSRHWNHGNAPDVSCSLGWSEQMVAEGSLSCLPLLPQARSL